jgi:hypothetical protein
MVNEIIFGIEGEYLHKLNNSSLEKNRIIKIGNKQFKYSKTQIALLSPNSFKFFIHHENPFIIKTSSDLNSNHLISCYEQLDSLFHSTNEITISVEPVELFSFLADFLDNSYLIKKCITVNSNQQQKFKFSSKQLLCYPKSWLNHLADFNLIINNILFKIDFSLFSCVCDKFQQLVHLDNRVEFSISNEYFVCFQSFFDIMKGYSFCFENTDFPKLKQLIDCFGITSLFESFSSTIPIPQTLEESLQFISQSFC